MSGATEAFARVSVRVRTFLKDAGRDLIDVSIVHDERTRAPRHTGLLPAP